MNLKIIAAVVAVSVLSAWGYGKWNYHVGWSEGRANLVLQQEEQARARLAKQTTRQQANDSKAAAADESGKATAEVITRDVIKYIKTPGRNVCTFDDARVLFKSRAAATANALPGYDTDASAVQDGSSRGQR